MTKGPQLKAKSYCGEGSAADSLRAIPIAERIAAVERGERKHELSRAVD
jgi:hypothetical protein